MMARKGRFAMASVYQNPEPVPPASQLTVLPFLAAVAGYLNERGDVTGLRITMHRAMSREGDEYLQQVSAYFRKSGPDSQDAVGRFFPVNDRIIGAAYTSGRIWRTRRYDTLEGLRTELRVLETDDVPCSYLAVPFLGPDEQVVLVLYADCNELNFFADNERIQRIVAMSNGFCVLLDALQKSPFPALRNFPLQKGNPVRGTPGLYRIQEQVDMPVPRFTEVPSFNFEAAAA